MKIKRLVPILFLTGREHVKLLSVIICAFLLVGCASPNRTARNKCREIKPGMTRAEIDKAGFVEVFGGMIPEPTGPHGFRQHVSFDCGGTVMVDVDFAPSDSKYERPTDTIMKISKPHLDTLEPRG